jgi:hypothetical protein
MASFPIADIGPLQAWPNCRKSGGSANSLSGHATYLLSWEARMPGFATVNLPMSYQRLTSRLAPAAAARTRACAR